MGSSQCRKVRNEQEWLNHRSLSFPYGCQSGTRRVHSNGKTLQTGKQRKEKRGRVKEKSLPNQNWQDLPHEILNAIELEFTIHQSEKRQSRVRDHGNLAATVAKQVFEELIPHVNKRINVHYKKLSKDRMNQCSVLFKY
ncbi:hypothetical protein TNCV_1220991 [Trichonephila clavipes]|nr:hypothetical protein TNCV_1220991 [Trichonephila clavipes]